MSALIRVQLSTQSAQIQPGERAELTLIVQNFSEIVDRYRITVDGIDPSWLTISRTEISLFPKDQDQVRMTLHPPWGPQTRAGLYQVCVRVRSEENPIEQSTATFDLQIPALYKFDLVLRPQRQSGLTEGIFTLQVNNQGNADLIAEFGASDPEDGCTYTFNPLQVTVPAGQERLTQLHVRPKRPLPGKVAKPYPFAVHARPVEAPEQVQRVQGEWEQAVPPRRLSWPIVLAVLLGLTAVVVALLVVPGLLWPTPSEPTTFAATALVPTADLSGTTVAEAVAATQTALRQATATAQAQATATAQAIAESDADGDGLTYAQEIAVGSDPNNPNTDGDILNDHEEVHMGTDPTVADAAIRYLISPDDRTPDLALRWEVSSDSLVYTFQLRYDIQLVDGSLFTAPWLAEYVLERVESGFELSCFGGTEVVDDYTFVLTLTALCIQDPITQLSGLEIAVRQ